MMSSEESDSGDEDVIIVKPLQWRHERVALIFRLDDAGVESKTTQAKRQRKQRTKSSVPSLRPCSNCTTMYF